MNDKIESIIQAEIDGTATKEEIALLESAAAEDPRVRSSRAEHAEIARAVGRMAAPVVPLGFTGRVMAALPSPARARVSTGDRVRSLLRSIVPAPRHQVALAFAFGVLATFMVTVTVTDWTQPDQDLLSGTLTAPSGTTVTLSGDAGELEAAWIDGVRRITVRTTEAMPLRVVVSGPIEDPPAVDVDVADGILTVERDGADVVISAERTGLVRFAVRTPAAFRIRVESGDELLADWSSEATVR